MHNDVDEDVPSSEIPMPNDADLHWDMIAQDMWNDYVKVCTE